MNHVRKKALISDHAPIHAANAARIPANVAATVQNRPHQYRRFSRLLRAASSQEAIARQTFASARAVHRRSTALPPLDLFRRERATAARSTRPSFLVRSATASGLPPSPSTSAVRLRRRVRKMRTRSATKLVTSRSTCCGSIAATLNCSSAMGPPGCCNEKRNYRQLSTGIFQSLLSVTAVTSQRWEHVKQERPEQRRKRRSSPNHADRLDCRYGVAAT